MLLSERQRLVAETGLLTLLAWMAVTIAFSNPPRSVDAGTRSAPMHAVEPGPSATTPHACADSLEGLQPGFTLMRGAVRDPVVTLPSAPKALPAGTVVRMGEGIHVYPEPREPQPCLTRSATGTSTHGPVP